jgi:hypothetical protein
MKVVLGGEQLYQLGSSPGLRVAATPFSPGKVYIGRLAFGRGAVPHPLTSYVGQTAKVAAACKGQRGYAFVACLRNKAKEMGITKGAKVK